MESLSLCVPSFEESIQREEDGAVHFWRKKNIFILNSHNLLIGLTIDGKYAWQEDEQKGDSNIVLMIQEQLFISELFKDIQDAISLILLSGQCCDSERILPSYLPHWMCV